ASRDGPRPTSACTHSARRRCGVYPGRSQASSSDASSSRRSSSISARASSSSERPYGPCGRSGSDGGPEIVGAGAAVQAATRRDSARRYLVTLTLDDVVRHLNELSILVDEIVLVAVGEPDLHFRVRALRHRHRALLEDA